jgi:molybdenum cofactor cytidylyltransferase
MSGPVSAVVLAAGESTRMKAPKALLEWQGRPLIRYQLEQLSGVPSVTQTIVVTGHDPEPIAEIAAGAGAEVAHNAAYRSGKVSSIVAGLRAVSDVARAIIVLAVDQPRSAGVIRRIVDEHARSGRPIVVPAHGGRRGHPPVFAASLLPELLRIDEATQGLRGFMEAHAADITEVECDANVLSDLNVAADVEREARRATP